MDLFVINRYSGDSVENNKANGKEQLKKLLQKIEERKKNRENHVPFRSISNGSRSSNGQVTATVSESVDLLQNDDENTVKSVESTDFQLETLPENENAQVDGFTVIQTKKFLNKSVYKSVLPQWLANPEVIPTNLQELSTSIDDISGLDEDLVDKLRKANITHFFPVQCKIIPYLLSEHAKPMQFWPCDVCVSSPTGSGKTLAFVLPIIQALKRRVVRKVRALVVLPVQDLAAQVYSVFTYYCSGTDLRVLLTTSKTPFPLEQQQLVRESVVSGFCSLVDIVVTTPGRLVGHLQTTPGFSLKHLRFLVIDEADRVLDKVQSDWLFYLKEHINADRKDLPLSVATLQMLPRPPQKLLFSATLSQDPEKLHQLSLFQPKLFTSIVKGDGDGCPEGEGRGTFLGKYTMPEELTENYCIVSEVNKPVLLYHLMQMKGWKHVLCFTDSQKISHRLCLLLRHLGQGEVVAEISSALKQTERDRILKRFIAGEIQVLVSSDALARGMDLQNVDCVVSYNMPKYVKNYIHRVGRTGRAGNRGFAVTFVGESERERFIGMLQRAGKDVEQLPVTEDELSYLSERYQTAMEKFGQALVEEKSKKIKFAKLQKVGFSYIKVVKRHKKTISNVSSGRNSLAKNKNLSKTMPLQNSSISTNNKEFKKRKPPKVLLQVANKKKSGTQPEEVLPKKRKKKS